jgi:peptidoglycan/LPS O-acetylase OafA/YrhL
MIRPSLSLYLNLLRFLAAVAVYLFHAQHFTNVRIPLIGNSGSEAVIVFFVLSGMLIAYASTRHPTAADYFTARLARLWSVALPALALTVLADTLGQAISLSSYAPFQPYSLFKWVASVGINALFLNQIWHLNIYAGTNGPFWSLSFEFWYYMIFMALFYFRGKQRVIAAAACMLIAGPAILIAMPIWLMGSAVYWAIKKSTMPAPAAGWVLWVGSFGLAWFVTSAAAHDFFAHAFPGILAGAKWPVDFWPQTYLLGAAVALNIYGYARIGDGLQAVLGKLAAPIRLGADTSFGLYLFHYPLLYLAKAVLNANGMTGGPAFAIIVYVVPFVVAVALALAFEKQKHVYARAIDGVAARLTRSSSTSMPAAGPRALARAASNAMAGLHDTAGDALAKLRSLMLK